MDDIAWSEPVPRRRRGATELDPPAWIHSPEREVTPSADTSEHDVLRLPDRPAHTHRHDGRRYEGRAHERRGFRAEDYLDQRGYAAELVRGWDTTPAAEPVVIEYTDPVDEEEIWGPRPRLIAGEAGGRRTVVITGRGGDRAVVPRSNPRDGLPLHARHGFQADRTAMWAVLLCVIVLLAAVASH